MLTRQKCEDHHIRILLINTRAMFTNQTWACEPCVDCSFVFSVMVKGHSLEMVTSWGGEPPAVVGATVALEEAAGCLPFGSISTVEILENIWKKLEAFRFLRKLKSFVNFRREVRAWRKQSNDDCWKDHWSFYRPCNGRDMRRVSWAQFELDTCPTRCLLFKCI